MNIQAVKWAKFVGYVAGGGLSALFVVGGPRWTAIGAAVVAVAGAVGALLPSPAVAITQCAKEVTPSGEIVGTNVTSKG